EFLLDFFAEVDEFDAEFVASPAELREPLDAAADGEGFVHALDFEVHHLADLRFDLPAPGNAGAGGGDVQDLAVAAPDRDAAHPVVAAAVGALKYGWNRR